ncbi:uncharacterized protein LOC103709336 isoform X2 [Phoenix dactylifera]|uniref:Uncharacterized protein LOC103709336 isoform X2 n=1 Tax=Phoenix dactylifera TaxID=42345 RepID=A0A8B7C6M9_PHODC|nr:uncharacterized protein LOC103709336 isoform X2 [Phoenix dactylifera]
MSGGRVEVVTSTGCSRFFVGSSTSIPSLNFLRPTEMMSPASSAPPESEPRVPSVVGPFTGLVICVTGLSKETRNQVMAATERLGGQYSASLHPQCTHLVVQSFGGRKFEHALKYGSKNGLLVVRLGWFVDSVRRNMRLNESLYSIKSVGESGLPLGEFNRLVELPGSEKSCLPAIAFGDERSSNTAGQPHLPSSVKELRAGGSVLSNDCIYIDSGVSYELKKKVVEAATREGAALLDHWFVGCHASHVVCEGPFVQRYIGHTNNLVTPLWVLKTAKEKCLQRLVHLSSDLARQVAIILENAQIAGEDTYGESGQLIALNSKRTDGKNKESLEERQKTVDFAKLDVRRRRCRRMQSCQIPIHPITPSSLLESICWSISEPVSSACIYTESSVVDDAGEPHTSVFFDARGDGRESEASFDNFSRPLRESEKREMIFKNHFLTILFPCDRFGELGPSSRTFFSEGGFTCVQVLEHIYNFYQILFIPFVFRRTCQKMK